MNIDELGFTREEILDRLVDKTYEHIFGREVDCDQDWVCDRVEREVKKNFQASVDEAVNRIGAQLIGPRIEKYIESVVLQKTNEYGEKKGEPVTFVEYLVSKATAYCEEEVNWDGVSRDRCSYSWKRYGSRIATMIDKHLQIQIESAIKKILENANSALAGGILAAVKIQLEELKSRLVVDTRIK